MAFMVFYAFGCPTEKGEITAPGVSRVLWHPGRKQCSDVLYNVTLPPWALRWMW